MNPVRDIGLVVPCYNEERRLDLPRFDAAGDALVLFVDDGSTDGTAALIASAIAGRPRRHLLRLERNRGKAEAVRRGMLRLRELDGFDALRWVGYWDADLSTSLDQLDYFLAFAGLEAAPPAAVWGSRVHRFGSRIERRGVRHVTGRAFATVVSNFLGIHGYDTQCGAKLFAVERLAACFGEPFVSGWVFDLELCYRLGSGRIVECPLRTWRDVKGSKIRLRRDLWRVAADLVRIRRRYGRYDEAPASV